MVWGCGGGGKSVGVQRGMRGGGVTQEVSTLYDHDMFIIIQIDKSTCITHRSFKRMLSIHSANLTLDVTIITNSWRSIAWKFP